MADKKINLLFKDTQHHSFRGLGIYSRELKKQLQKHPKINLTASARQADIIHYPEFNLFTKIKTSYLSKTIFTIHDLIPLELPHLFPLGIKAKLAWWHNRHNLKKALHIITDSKASKQSIIKFTAITDSKVTSIHLASRSTLKKQKKLQSNKKFALYVGDVNPNKNIKRIVIACLTNNLPLYIVGRSALAPVKKHSRHPELQDLIWLQKQSQTHSQLIKLLGFVSDKKLSRLYQSASVCLQPSLAEGFGLPVIEALKMGCPVITSNTSSLPEVGGKACFYLNPTSQEELTATLKKVISLSPTVKLKRIKNGQVHANSFTWEKTARQTIDLYKSLL